MNPRSIDRELSQLDEASRRLVLDLIGRLAGNRCDPPQSIELNSMLQPWLDRMSNEGKSPITQRNYAYLIRKFLRQFPAPSPIEIDAYFTLLRTKSTLGTLAFHSNGLKSFLGFCQSRCLAMDQVIAAIPTIKRPRRRRAAPPDEDIELLLTSQGLKLRTRALLYILADSGPRISEVLTLRRSAVDLKHAQATVCGR